MREDRREITISEPARVSAHPERMLDLPGAVQLGEVDRLGHLPSDARGALGGRSGQPCLSAGSEREERLLLARAGAGRALKRARRPGWIVLILDARPSRRGQLVPSDLSRPLR